MKLNRNKKIPAIGSCKDYLHTLISGHLYLHAEQINKKLRKMNRNLRQDLLAISEEEEEDSK
jgi:hypothetical protein